MSAVNLGDKAPDFTLPKSGGGEVALTDYTGKYLKDDFAALGAEILGVSKDTVAKHDKFITKHELDIPLGSDVSGEMIESYGSWVEKNMYGKKYMGIDRSTFLIGPDGIVLEVWRKVRVKVHVEAVLDALKTHNA